MQSLRRMKTIAYSLLIITAGSLVACSQQQETIGTPVQQVSVARIDSMPDMPQPYKMLDWRKKAEDFDRYAFNFDTKVNGNPIIG